MQYAICEYGTIYPTDTNTTEENSFEEIFLPASTFHLLKNFATEYQESKINQVISLQYQSGKDLMKVKNFVGTIELADDTQIEILPKIYPHASSVESKKILIAMLKTLPNLPFITLQDSHLQIDNQSSLLEIFIQQFLKEVEKLLQKSLQHDYIVREEAQPYLSGKVIVSEDIKQKLTQPHLFYTQYQAFVADTIPNRLIKTVLIQLNKRPLPPRQINDLLIAFEQINLSDSPLTDLIIMGRDIRSYQSKPYEKIFLWIQLFLQESIWTNFGGDYFGLSLLFPMQQVFERYISQEINAIFRENYQVISQEKSRYLVVFPTQQFGLQPDIIIKNNYEKVIMLIDIKWKIIDEKKRNMGIDEQDMYQIYVYGQKYECENLVLIYPQNSDFQEHKVLFFEENQKSKLTIFCWKWQENNLRNLLDIL
jgi:5-methylcytosine-specific restriction enzyme subunit McrC